MSIEAAIGTVLTPLAKAAVAEPGAATVAATVAETVPHFAVDIPYQPSAGTSIGTMRSQTRAVQGMANSVAAIGGGLLVIKQPWSISFHWDRYFGELKAGVETMSNQITSLKKLIADMSADNPAKAALEKQPISIGLGHRPTPNDALGSIRQTNRAALNIAIVAQGYL